MTKALARIVDADIDSQLLPKRVRQARSFYLKFKDVLIGRTEVMIPREAVWDWAIENGWLDGSPADCPMGSVTRVGLLDQVGKVVREISAVSEDRRRATEEYPVFRVKYRKAMFHLQLADQFERMKPAEPVAKGARFLKNRKEESKRLELQLKDDATPEAQRQLRLAQLSSGILEDAQVFLSSVSRRLEGSPPAVAA